PGERELVRSWLWRRDTLPEGSGEVVVGILDLTQRYLSNVVEVVDHVRKAVAADRRWAVDEVKVQMRGTAVATVAELRDLVTLLTLSPFFTLCVPFSKCA